MTTPEQTAEAAKKPSVVMTIALLAALSVVAAGGGWLMGGMIAPQSEPVTETATATDDDAAEHGTDPAAAVAPSLVDLEPITTNLSYPADNWIRLEVSLLFTAEPDPVLAHTIHQDILAYLRTVSLQQIEGPRGFQHLRDDLSERAVLRSDGKVSTLLFKTFVIE